MIQNRLSIRKFFENNWETMVLWLVLIGFFYLLRPFFLLIFETFLITYITKSIVKGCVGRFKLNYCLTTVIVFLLFVSLLVTIAAWIGPRLIVESNNVLAELAGAGKENDMETAEQFTDKVIIGVLGKEKGQNFIGSNEYIVMMEAFKDGVGKAAKAIMPHVLVTLLDLAKLGWKMMLSLILAIIFSFILVKDWRKITDKMEELGTSRIRTFYLGAMPHLIAFADVLGKALRAQAIIAASNTIITALGLWLFDVPNVALLSTVVFFCGFIPILGTFLSSIPILLFGIQAGGLALGLKLIALIAIVHTFEAYVLNPKITAKVLHIHPILVLILLLIGERFFGIWGMVVGVPIGYYLISVLIENDDNVSPESQNENNKEPAR
ncbi:MAG: AI-2E family transporter [Kiritimatiellia bacterium]|nr:AI-2E family transporter [Kiritimatiellia bacterium]